MYKYLFLILFGIILFLYNNTEGFSIGGLNFRLYKINENFELVNVDMGGGIGGDYELINRGTMDQQTFDTIQTELQRNPSMDPRIRHPEVFNIDFIDSMVTNYNSERALLTQQLETEGLDREVIDKILDLYFKNYFETLKEYSKLEKQLCSSTYTSTFEDSSTYDLDVLFGERDPMSPLNDRLLSLDTDLFRKIFREKLRTNMQDYSFNFDDLLEFLHTYRDYYGFSGSSDDEDSDDEESEEYLTEQQFVNIFSLFIAVLLSRGYELEILMEYIESLQNKIPAIIGDLQRNDYITISEIIIKMFLDGIVIV